MSRSHCAADDLPLRKRQHLVGGAHHVRQSTGVTMSSKSIQDPRKRALWEKSVAYDATLDSNALAELWHLEGSVQIASNPKVTGRDSIRGFFGHFFGLKLFKKLTHQMIEVWELPDATIYNAIATYTLPDDSVVSYPYVNIVKYRDGLFFDYKVFIDAKLSK
jgi:hypothetical protein